MRNSLMSEHPTHRAAERFGTFGGVFTPCVLTILGVIMFLRFGQVTGNAGVAHAILIVLLAKSITFLTALSLSAITTNTRVRGGGAYYLISRSLGVESGGTIGVVFFGAQSVAAALYVLGFSEAFVAAFPGLGVSIVVVATVVNVLTFVVVYVGADWTIRVQYVVLAVLGLALASFWVGVVDDFSLPTLRLGVAPAYLDGESFFTMFALFFPAVTGIMAGANMSGDLRDPGRSIPRGTLWAIGVTAVIYLSLTILMSGSRAQTELIANPLVMADIAWSPAIITAGIFAATISSGLSSMLGAPRILQALARDDIFPSLRVFASGSAKTNEPRAAAVATFLIAQACILLGDLNAIAPVITMFFLITYGMINLATFYESIARNPSYRPTFRLSHWTTELLGAVGCVVVMFLISPVWAIASMVSIGGLHWYIGRKQIRARWGDVKQGAAFERARSNLLRLEDERRHPKNWRPIILALSGGAWSRMYLAVYGHWLTAGHGVLTLAQIIVGDVTELLARRKSQEEMLERFISEQHLESFPATIVAPSLADGIRSVVQAHGVGAVRPNTVLIGWTGDAERFETFGTTLRTIAGLKRSIVAIRSAGVDRNDPWTAPPGTIDVWWRGRENGTLMVLLAHLLVQNDEWRQRTIRVLRVIPSESGREDAARHLADLIDVARIRARPVIVVAGDVPRAIRQTSADAAAVLLGFTPPEKGSEVAFVDGMDRLAGQLDTVLFVSSAGGMELEA